MIEFLLSLPNILGAIVIVALTSGAGLAVYMVSYKLVSTHKNDDLKNATSNLFRVIGTLVALMLSLAFADVIVKFRAIENAVALEAVAISDIHEDLKRFDPEATTETRAMLAEYTQAVVDDDWIALADNRLGERAGDLINQLSARAMDLTPNNPKQEKLWARLLVDIDAVSDHRMIRLNNALAEPPVFLYVVLSAFLLTMACFGAYRPEGAILVLVFLYTVMIGSVLCIILGLSDPYQGIFKVEPTVFEHLVERLTADNGPN